MSGKSLTAILDVESQTKVTRGFIRQVETWKHSQLRQELDNRLDRLSELGFIVSDTKGANRLSQRGIEEANKLDKGL